MRIKAFYIELLFMIAALIMAVIHTITSNLRFLVYGLILACFPTLYETLLKIAEYQDERNNDEV